MGRENYKIINIVEQKNGYEYKTTEYIYDVESNGMLIEEDDFKFADGSRSYVRKYLKILRANNIILRYLDYSKRGILISDMRYCKIDRVTFGIGLSLKYKN